MSTTVASLSLGVFALVARVATVGAQVPPPLPLPVATAHYEYVFPDGNFSVYDMDNGHQLVKSVALPQAQGIRGVIAHAATHSLYISYGGDGNGQNGTPTLLKYDLLTDAVVWTHTYAIGIDSMSITPDGTLIYMPTGELASGGTWYVLSAATGDVVASIDGPLSPHNTIVSLDGAHVYLGGRAENDLAIADTATNQVVRRIGPLQDSVRPFTINGRQTIAYVTVTGLRGFQMGDIGTGQVLGTVTFTGPNVSSLNGPSAPSHGISLSPDEREIYVVDWPDYVHVFDVSGVPARAPQQVADIALTPSMNHFESPCLYDCLADGWLQHSRDGRFVYVGDQGDVIDTATRQAVTNLSTLANTRKMIEIDWAAGVPVFAATARASVGYVVGSPTTTSTQPVATTTLPTTRTTTTTSSTVPTSTTTTVPASATTTLLAKTTTTSSTSTTSPSPTTTTIQPPPSGGIALLQSSAVEGSGLGSISSTFPSSNTAGNLIIAFVRMSTTSQMVKVTDGAGNAYTDAVAQPQTADGHQVHIFYAKNVVGGANTVTATFSAANNHPWLAIYEYSGLSTTSPLDQTANAQGSSSTPSSGATATTASANELVFAATGLPASYPGTVTAGSGYTLQQQDTGTSRAGNEAAAVTSTGSFVGTFGLSSSANWTAVLATFAAAPATPTTTSTLATTTTTTVACSPPIVCPPDITVECTNSTGGTPGNRPEIAAFRSGAHATEACGSVTITDDAPAFFNSGTTSVTFTATDADGHESSCKANVTVAAGAAGERIVLNRLAGLIPSGDPGTDQQITFAMKEIGDGLNSGLFLDDSHLDPQGGTYIFSETENSVRSLMAINDAPAAVSQAIGSLECVDGSLAQTAIADAMAAGGDPATIAAAQEASTEALEEIREGEFDEAIQRYENAWQSAESAIGH